MPCRFDVAADGLPHRSEAVLRRERAHIPAYIERLAGGDVKGEPMDDPEPPTVDELVSALEARDSRTLGVAAFLAGRCRGPDDAGARLTAALADLVSNAPAAELDLLDEGYVEAAFSLGLRGDPDRAREALSATMREESSQDWLAVAYLAQLGDPSGWPALHRDLREGIDHVRLMAARQLIMFVPYDGTEVAGMRLDIESELGRLADDPSEWVRNERADLLAEAGFAP